ncbi:MAG: TIGR03620 family F420-dependent LLM class oxidoreductase [Deltaproteobacteria bacterium]|nr:TIGR03620 family F420-dependent LLM class oxidoreductase [Deltaproteobacteria bacterium]MBW2399896.1 TIGR03620 family F420-dependent LLM class oxidoreductase [Deltaproteobacteria bacterium]MBW2665182.1 TIGR03620 family F420-dependent LLM class oxidoreductase [Deltaproteobacteria bacterium]
MELGRLGVWTWLDDMSGPEAAKFAQRLEQLGYSALWVPEAVGRDPFSMLGYLAAQTERLILATGIANIYARDPMLMNAIHNTIGDLAPGRFILGIGVSHGHLVTGVRGHEYGKPLSTMRNYLESMQNALFMARKPGEAAPILLAALRPRMLELSASAAQGAHPYFVPPEHTARAREILGAGPMLCPEQMVLLETDASEARAIARKNMEIYAGLPNYRNNLKWLGFEDSDFENGCSDRLVDAIVVWGDEKAIAKRIQEHWDAGADHVCIQPLRPDGKPGADLRVLEALAPNGR